MGSLPLTCPYNPDHPQPYQPIGIGDHKYSGAFDCEPTDSIQVEANPIPDASQFMSPDQCAQIEQSKPEIPAGNLQATDIFGFTPASESMDSLQNLDPDVSSAMDGSLSESQIDIDFLYDEADNQANDQDALSY